LIKKNVVQRPDATSRLLANIKSKISDPGSR